MVQTVTDIVRSSWPTLVIFLATTTIIRLAYLKYNKKKFVFHTEFLLLLFVAYIFLLFELVTYEDVSYSSSNFIPFREILRYDFGTTGFYKQVIGNILLFVPFGYFAAYYVKVGKIGGIFIMTLLTSTVIETVQYFIGRTFDIDDIILNVVGGIIGFLIYIGLDAIKKKLPKLFQKDFFYTFLSLVLLVFIVLYFFKIYNIW